MDTLKCMAVVPYVPEKQRVSYLSEVFARRKATYLLLLPLMVASVFSGAYYCLFYSAKGIFIPYGELLLKAFSFEFSSCLFYIFVIALSFTIFSAAGGIVLMIPLSFSCGFTVCSAFLNFGFDRLFFLTSVIESVFLLSVLIYSAEICLRLTVTRQGIKYMIAMKNTAPLLIKTLVFYSCFTLNYFYIAEFEILKGLI